MGSDTFYHNCNKVNDILCSTGDLSNDWADLCVRVYCSHTSNVLETPKNRIETNINIFWHKNTIKTELLFLSQTKFVYKKEHQK